MLIVMAFMVLINDDDFREYDDDEQARGLFRRLSIATNLSAASSNTRSSSDLVIIWSSDHLIWSYDHLIIIIQLFKVIIFALISIGKTVIAYFVGREETLRKRDKVPDNREVEIINKWKELDTVHVMKMRIFILLQFKQIDKYLNIRFKSVIYMKNISIT